MGAGAPIGYAIDVFKDLTGLEECNRKIYPNFIKNQKPLIKKSLAGLVTAGAVGLTAGVYALAR